MPPKPDTFDDGCNRLLLEAFSTKNLSLAAAPCRSVRSVVESGFLWVFYDSPARP